MALNYPNNIIILILYILARLYYQCFVMRKPAQLTRNKFVCPCPSVSHTCSTTVTQPQASGSVTRYCMQGALGWAPLVFSSCHSQTIFPRKMSSNKRWQSDCSTATSDICQVCKSVYPVCETCKRYGKQPHVLDKEKSVNCHDNGGYSVTENSDPRK